VVSEGPEPAPERRAELVGALLGRGLGFTLRRLLTVRRSLTLRRPESARVPQVDVQELDLLDQEQDCATGGPDLVPTVVEETLAPRPQSLELVFVEPGRRQSLLPCRRDAPYLDPVSNAVSQAVVPCPRRRW
jgi:hypothetical protein